MTTYIIGHIKPDADAIVSAMAFAHLLQESKLFNQPNPKAVRSGDINNETKFVFDKFKAELPPELTHEQILDGDQFVLVDHNEDAQRHPLVAPDRIIEVVDHHKLNLNLEKPIFVNTKPWGSTSTIVWWLTREHEVYIPKQLAGLMLSAVLSDTVGFKSATTTTIDREAGHDLAQIAEVSDLDQFTFEIFKAKSDIASLTPSEIVKHDYKVFDFGGKTVMIDQIETVEQNKVLEQKDQLIDAMNEIKTAEEIDHIFVAISDVLTVNTKMIVTNEVDAAIAEKAFGGNVTESIIDIGAKLSRKKEIAPAIESIVANPNK